MCLSFPVHSAVVPQVLDCDSAGSDTTGGVVDCDSLTSAGSEVSNETIVSSRVRWFTRRYCVPLWTALAKAVAEPNRLPPDLS